MIIQPPENYSQSGKEKTFIKSSCKRNSQHKFHKKKIFSYVYNLHKILY